MRKFGIDISRWQRGMDLAQAQAEGVEFVILRGANSCDKDSCFDGFYRQARALGLGVGCYQYSLATTVEEAQQEAAYLIDNVLAGRQFDYPVYLDCEDETQKALGPTAVDAVIRAWCDTLEAAGYFAGVYTNGDFYRRCCSGAELSARYTWWYAAWCRDEITDYPMHQFGGGINPVRSVRIAGYVCDQDYCYADFPAVIRAAGKNGCGAKETEEAPAEEAEEAPAKETEEAPAGTAQQVPAAKEEREERTVTLTFNYLQREDSGPQVVTLQALLNAFDEAALAVDGVFGDATLRAVMAYQRSRRLTVDGVVGPETWTQLLLR